MQARRTGRTLLPDMARAAIARSLAATALAALLALSPVPALAVPVEVEISAEADYGRLVVSFADRNLLPGYRASAVNGVLVLTFDEAVTIDVARVPIVLGRYVTIARADPDGRGARFALARGVTVNTMEAGPRLFIDFLPQTRRAPPPGLPEEVVAELARKAEEASKAARQAELLRLAGADAAKLEVNSAEGPTFSRFVFRWNIPFEAEFRRDGGGVVITFDQTAEVDLGPVRAALPRLVSDIAASPTPEGGLALRLSVDPAADVRAFREDMTFIVDVQGDGEPEAVDPAAEALLSAAREENGLPADAVQVVAAPGEPAPAPSAPPEPPAMVTSPVPAPAAAPAPEPPQAAEAAAAAAEPPPAASAASAVELSDETGDRVLDDGVIRVEAKRIGRTTRIVFPYREAVGSALFTRGPALWMVFDDTAPIEAAPLQDALAGYARKIDVFQAGTARVVRVEMAEPLLATLNPDNTYWVVTIGDMVVEPTRPLPVRRVVAEDGGMSLDVPFGPVAATHEIVDPAAGDRVFVVTGRGQPRGLVKPQDFAELDALSSAHGLAFVPEVDDLAVTVKDEVVRIGRPGGLAVSNGGLPQRQSLIDLPGAEDRGSRRAGHVDFSGAETEGPEAYWALRHALADRVASAEDPAAVVEAWYDTATFHIANGLGAEALGALKLIAARDAEQAVSERMAVLTAGAEVLMGRPGEALRHLDRTELAGSQDAAVWRAIANAERGDYAAAHRDFVRGEGVIGGFPASVQRRFTLAGVRAAIELNDFGRARTLIAQIDPSELGDRELSELDILNARVMDANGLASQAIDTLAGVVRDGRGAPAAEATYRLVRMQRREGLITLDQALDRLEQLAVSWRGDDTEMQVLRALGQMSIEKGDHRRAFEVLRAAMQVDPDSESTRLMNEEMQSAFADLFLDGGADAMKPVDALALYYDFRELTPPGRRGDAMVRRLADRLVDVDLLPQAAELLAYQVENRLRGAARAEVAADLAMVHLLDQRPDRALMTLARTRQSGLPVTIERQRRTVEARALADTGKPDLGLDLLKPLEGRDIDRLRAEILWDADRHQEAGEAFERLLGGRWSDDLPLTETEQLDLLRAGIAYTLADDPLGVDRLRTKYAAKMGRTPNAVAFDTVTAPVSTKGRSFDQVVRSIASIDQAEGFLADYRTRFRSGTDDAEPSAPTPTAGADEMGITGIAG